jgi:hypothetical protein
MTIDISNNDPRISYSVASGVTQDTFAVPFEFFEDSDLNVYVDGVLKTITADYELSGGGGSTGTVSITVVGASGGSTVTLTRDTVIERITDFTAGVDINRAALNTQLDTLTAISADVKDLAERAIRVEDVEVAPNLVLPSIANRLGKTLAFNSTTGAVEAGPSVGDVQNASANAATATTKASEAALSATSAANSAAAAASAFDNFDDTYLGSKTSDPTVDNDGDPLTEGDLYFNSSNNEMRVYDGANWIAASSSGTASLINYNYTATASQTVFSGADDNALSLSYIQANIIVTLNGVFLEGGGTDYTATDGISITLTSAASAGDDLNIVSFKSFTVADVYTKTQSDSRYIADIEITKTVLTTGTAATYTTPTDAVAIEVEVLGAGGGGGGVDGQGSGKAGCASAGGAGGYSQKTIMNPASSYTYTIGAGGAGAAAGNNAGSTGGTTSFADGASVTLSGSGGGGGQGRTASGGGTINPGSLGGVASGGDLNIQGQCSSAGATTGGARASLSVGGSTKYGAGAKAANGTAQSPAGFGSGGGAPSAGAVTTNYAGTAGADGVIVITEYRS